MDMIALMDAVNHAIPTRDELASALGALVGAGLVEPQPQGFRVTTAGAAIRELWDGAPGGGDDAMVAALAAHQRPQREWPLTQEQVAQAYQAYTDRLR